MNLFMPYYSIAASVRSLDDVRLNKQILECYQILRVALGESEGYKNHPIVKHYSQYPGFVARYGWQCCGEYNFRTNKHHKYEDYFYKTRWSPANEVELLYAEYSKNDPRCIRTNKIKEVCTLYQRKLCNKWDQDSRKQRNARWTCREVPDFYSQHRNVIEQMKLMNY